MSQADRLMNEIALIFTKENWLRNLIKKNNGVIYRNPSANTLLVTHIECQANKQISLWTEFY